MCRLPIVALGLLLGFFAIPTYAGPMPQCVAATLSADGNILVINDLTLEKEGSRQKFKTSTFRVLHRLNEINAGLRLDGPDKYWSFPLWSVVFTREKSDFIACPYTLVTNDGEYLVFIHDWFARTALSIYRRSNHPGQPFSGQFPDHGVLIRDIPLSEIWAEHMPPTAAITDHTPQWYAEGTFVFSGNQTLIHKTRWNQIVQIDLATGKVTRQ